MMIIGHCGFYGKLETFDFEMLRCSITIAIYSKNEKAHNFKVNEKLIGKYTFLIMENRINWAMEPQGALEECFDVYHEYESYESLNPWLRKLWCVANIIDNAIYKLATMEHFMIRGKNMN